MADEQFNNQWWQRAQRFLQNFVADLIRTELKGLTTGPGDHLVAARLDGQVPTSSIASGTPGSGTVPTSNGSGGVTWQAPSGGTVTSVGLTMPAEFTVSGSPVTGSGALAVSKANESPNTVYAGPTSGGAAAPTFRALVAGDLPATTVSNPMTTKGDLIAGGASGTPTRLAAAEDQAVLITDSTQGDGLTWRLPLLAVAYNYETGGAGGSAHKIGFGLSSDGRRFSRKIEPAIDLGAGGSWDVNSVKDACLVVVNGLIYCYYRGYSSTNNGAIGVAISYDGGATFVKYSGNPILQESVAWEGAAYPGLTFPAVLYDVAETNAAKRWKLWYAGGATSDGSGGIGYAYSADGLSWTKYASNPVIAPSGGANWDAAETIPGACVRLGSTYYLFYGGCNGSGVWKTGLVTFTDPQGTYTRSANNPLNAGDGITQALTVDVTIGDTTLHVADATVYPVGAAIYVYDATHRYITHVTGRPTSTTITVADAAPVGLASASGAVRSLAIGNIGTNGGGPYIRSALYDGGWVFGLTIFEDDAAGFHEFAALGYADNQLKTIYLDYSAGLIVRPTLAESQNASVSFENPSIAWLADAPRRFNNTAGVTSVSGTAPVSVSNPTTTPVVSVAAMVASGGSHASGLAPDPGASAGTTHFLREDATWAVPVAYAPMVIGSAGATTPTFVVNDQGQPIMVPM